MPNHPTQTDATPVRQAAAVSVARFVAVGQAGAIGIKSAGDNGRITIGGMAPRVIRVGAALP